MVNIQADYSHDDLNYISEYPIKQLLEYSIIINNNMIYTGKENKEGP